MLQCWPLNIKLTYRFLGVKRLLLYRLHSSQLLDVKPLLSAVGSQTFTSSRKLTVNNAAIRAITILKPG